MSEQNEIVSYAIYPGIDISSASISLARKLQGNSVRHILTTPDSPVTRHVKRLSYKRTRVNQSDY